MCLSSVYSVKDGEKKLLCKNIASVKSEDGILVFTNIMGIPTKVEGTLELIDLMDNFIYVRAVE